MNIRLAQNEDIDIVFSIETASSSTPWSRQSFINELSLSFSRFYVVEDDREIIAFAVLWNVSGEIQLNNIAVAEKMRRQGVATGLMRHIINRAQAEKADRIQLEVKEKSLAARKFYASLGFVENGYRRNYYRDDHAVLMELNIRNKDLKGPQ